MPIYKNPSDRLRRSTRDGIDQTVTYYQNEGTSEERAYDVPLYRCPVGWSAVDVAKELGGRVPSRREEHALIDDGQAIAAVVIRDLGTVPIVRTPQGRK